MPKTVALDPKDEALTRFCDTVDATGGIIEFRDGTSAPEADPEWIDLAYAYTAACVALKREPKTRKAGEDDEG